jgi:hypothetical protein
VTGAGLGDKEESSAVDAVPAVEEEEPVGLLFIAFPEIPRKLAKLLDPFL